MAMTIAGGNWRTIAIVTLYLTLSVGSAVVSNEALADKWRRQCTAVSVLAEIEYDSRLPVSIASDSSRKICVFYISLPPNLSADAAISKAALAFNSYASLDSSNPKFVAMLKGPQLVEPTLNALLATLDDERLRSPAAKDLITAVLSREQTIRTCVERILVKKIKLEKIDDVITCGLSEDNSHIIFEASLGSLSVSMLLPFA